MVYDKAIMFSGGVDSLAVAAMHPGTRDKKNALVFVDVGQRYAAKEFLAARKVVETLAGKAAGLELHRLRGPNLARWEVGDTGIIPHRNALLALMGAQFSSDILFGVLAGEINSDKSREFMDAMKFMLDISRRPQYWTEGVKHSITSPIRNKTKTQVVADLIENGYEAALLKTVSCYSGSDVHCGQCPSCFKRWVAFKNNDLDTSNFLACPATWALKQGELDKCQDGTYGPRRAQEIMEAFKHEGLLGR